jgi:small subunit ribosomal protein S16
MALKIRLTKVGATHKPYYRVVVAEARSRRDGAATEVLGTYQPTNKVKAEQCKLVLARVDYWLGKGAKPTDTVHALIKRYRKSSAAEAAPAATVAAAPVEATAAPATT